ncbi:hypothetical protein CRD60_03075 [Bifidobacterium aemilianum]|uniref:Alcohol dehydrogenase-like C-terminal domain-containing protein n=1 Tax=Bifidobacterium aemilianum TaxID=2493120 RepID=A0A366K8V4_9BIFI|nr:hypothetical protein [Bifidobacterium aemilianum]RBP98146.1 hypothetical protein CRD60_03075 [Bifidobacterium aemilianum]
MDTTGVPTVVNNALHSLAFRVHLATLAVSGKPTDINMTDELVTPSISISGVIENDAIPQGFIPMLVGFYRKGLFPIDKLTKFYDLDQIDQAFQDSTDGKMGISFSTRATRRASSQQAAT